MTADEIQTFLRESRDEYLKSERIENPPFPRRDLCAFVKLHELCPQEQNLLGGASHDVIFFSMGLEELAERATETDLIYLHRCGVRYDTSGDSLAMYV